MNPNYWDLSQNFTFNFVSISGYRGIDARIPKQQSVVRNNATIFQVEIIVPQSGSGIEFLRLLHR